MAAGTFLPAFDCLIFLPKQLMPDSRIQLRLQGQDCPKEIITVYSTVMDGLVGGADDMAGPILRQAATIVIYLEHRNCGIKA